MAVSPNDSLTDNCLGSLHPQALQGIELFNSGHYWHAHEALEEAWLDETSEIRNLYRGILQVSVTYFHIERGNYRGALKVYQRCRRWLAPFPPICRGVNVGKLKDDLESAIAEVRRLGPDRLNEFDRTLLRPIIFS